VPLGQGAGGDGDEPEIVWAIPSTELLDTITGKRERLAVEVRSTGETIVTTLRSFGIDTRIIGANSGSLVAKFQGASSSGGRSGVW